MSGVRASEATDCKTGRGEAGGDEGCSVCPYTDLNRLQREMSLLEKEALIQQVTVSINY